MIDIDVLSSKLNEMKQQHEITKEQTLKKIGVFEQVEKTSSDSKDKFVANLAINFLMERATRIGEDLLVLEIALSLIEQQAQEIDALRQLVASSTSYEKLAEDVKKRLKDGLKQDYGEAFDFLEDLKQRLAEQDTDVQEKVNGYNR